MAQQIINTGTADKGNGDPIRTAFTKVNANFTELYNHVSAGVVADDTAPTAPGEGDLWWDTVSGRLYVYYGSNWVDASPVDGVGGNLDLSAVAQSILPSANITYDLGSTTKRWRDLYLSGNTIDLGGTLINSDGNGGLSIPGGITSDGTLEFADGLTIVDGVIGKSSSTTISEETPGGTISETTEIESQIEIATTGIVIAKRTRIIVDDAVTTTTDEAGSTLTVNNSTASIKHYAEPDGPNNGSYFQVSTSGVGAVLEGVNETLNGTEYGRVIATQNAVTVNTSVDGVAKYWLFDYLGGLTLPTPTSQVFTVTFDSNHYTPTVGKPSLELTSEPWQLEGQIQYEQNGTASLQLTNIWPTLVNPGYDSGDAFTFSTLVHGLSDYTLTITLNDVVLPGGAGWTANVGASQLPAYPSNISANGAIKLTAGNESFIFGADGSLHFPDGSFQGSAFVGLASTAQDLYKAGEIFIGIGDGVTTTQQWSFGTDGSITLPNIAQLTAADSVSISVAGAGLTDLENTYIGALAFLDAVFAEESLTPGYPWGITLPVSYATYTELVQLTPDTFPAQASITVTAKAASDAYTDWQAALTATNVSIGVAGNDWTFGADGKLTVPGSIFRDGALYMNSQGSTTTASVIALGNAGSVILRTSNQSTNHDLTFDVDGNTSFPGRLNFADGSSYNDSTLTGAIDSDLALEVKRTITVSDVAAAGSTTGTLIVDISENDDITVVAPGWEINAGSEIAPQWMTVTVITVNPDNTIFEITVDGFVFEPGNEYTFRNPVPESNIWVIRSQTGGITGPGGVVITNETAPLGGGDTYRELAIELPAPGALFNEQRWVFANDGSLTLPQYNQIASVGSNATITLNGVGSNESILELATSVTGEQIASNFYMAPGGFGFNSVRSIDIHAGYEGGTFKYDFWQGEEAVWVEVRNQDAQLIAPDIRPWDGMPSYEAYNEILLYTAPPGVLPQPDSLVVVANTAKAAYELWQAEQAAINVTVSAKDKTWTFGNNGSVTLPNGASIKDNANDALAFGEAAGSINQSGFSIAIGPSAGFSSQGGWAIAIGALAGYVSQGAESVAVGNQAGSTEQGAYSVAIGEQSGAITQGTQAVAIGPDAGRTSQGAQAIAIGNSAGYLNQHPNSIILNASGSALNSDGESRFYVNPIRNDSTQNNVLLYNTSTKEVTYDTLKGSGSWTVTTGTNTYSFEVTSGATYSLWVRGTTDNGVISWNATVTITNANLPALGQQFAYAYSGAGTLLDFTSIPNQIIGTSGAVTRSATTLGVPAGLFEFGINNTSGASVTVYWGWTKI